MTFEDCLDVWYMMYRYVLEIHSRHGEWLFVHYDQVLDGDGLERLATFLEVSPDQTFPDAALRHVRLQKPVPLQAQRVYQHLCRLANWDDSK
jgi:hypothetical protein